MNPITFERNGRSYVLLVATTWIQEKAYATPADLAAAGYLPADATHPGTAQRAIAAYEADLAPAHPEEALRELLANIKQLAFAGDVDPRGTLFSIRTTFTAAGLAHPEEPATAADVVREFVAEREEQLSRAYDSPLTTWRFGSLTSAPPVRKMSQPASRSVYE